MSEANSTDNNKVTISGKTYNKEHLMKYDLTELTYPIYFINKYENLNSYELLVATTATWMKLQGSYIDGGVEDNSNLNEFMQELYGQFTCLWKPDPYVVDPNPYRFMDEHLECSLGPCSCSAWDIERAVFNRCIVFAQDICDQLFEEKSVERNRLIMNIFKIYDEEYDES